MFPSRDFATQQLMPVFVPLICTHIYQITYLTGQIPIWVLQHLITRKNHYFASKIINFFPESTIPFLQSPVVIQTAPRATLFPQKWKETLPLALKAPLKPALGNMVLYRCWNDSAVRKHIQWAMRSTHRQTWAGNCSESTRDTPPGWGVLSSPGSRPSSPHTKPH